PALRGGGRGPANLLHAGGAYPARDDHAFDRAVRRTCDTGVQINTRDTAAKGRGMPSIQEAADQLGKDLVTQNMASLMMALTPEGMMKAMALQGQMMAAQQAAAAAGLQPPAPP